MRVDNEALPRAQLRTQIYVTRVPVPNCATGILTRASTDTEKHCQTYRLVVANVV